MLSAAAVYLTAHGQGPFVGGGEDVELLRAQLFAGIVTAAALLMGAVSAERATVEAELATREADNQALRDSELAMAEAQRIAHVGSWRWDIAADRVTWSDELYRIYGYSPSSFTASYAGYLESVHPDHRERVDRLIRNAAINQRPFEFAYEIVRADGEVRAMLSHGDVTVVDGLTVGMKGTCQDVTERVQAERKFQQFLEFAPDPILGVDADGRIVLANAKVEQVFGYERDALLGERVELLLPGGFGHAKSGRRQDGSEFPAEISFSSIETEDGPMATASVRDITERVQAERELIEARRQRASRLESVGQLAGGVAHDFNNILGVIINYADFAADQLEPGSGVRGDVEEIQRAAERAAALTRQLLLFSRGEAAATESIELGGLLTDLDRLLCRAVGEEVELEVYVDPDLLPLEADRSQLEQILVNLAVNARDAMPRGGRLTIRAVNVVSRDDAGVAGGARVLITVSDTGTGMSAEVRERAFEPFYTTKPVGDGTGLGLATVYGLVTGAGGQIALESEPGCGTTVAIELPAGTARPGAAAPGRHAARPTRRGPDPARRGRAGGTADDRPHPRRTRLRRARGRQRCASAGAVRPRPRCSIFCSPMCECRACRVSS